MSNRISASFRDPSGFVFSQGNKIYRQVNLVYQEDYDLLMSTGLYDRIVKGNFLIPHQEVTQIPILPELAYKVIEPEMISLNDPANSSTFP